MSLLPLGSLLKVIVCVASVTVTSGVPTSTDQIKKLRDIYDFIIVGGGTAGCVLANRLSENPDWQVLLLEAGDDEIIDYNIPAVPTHSLSRIKWGYHTEPDENSCLSMPGGVCEVPTAKVLGGSSVINDMKYLRGSRFDYDEWADKGCRGWNYASLLEFFKKSEDNGNNGIAINTLYHARGGHLHVETLKHSDKNVGRLISAFYEIGYKNVDLNANVKEGVMRVQFTQRNNTRLSTNKAFLHPVRNRGNLQILTSAYVSKIIINEDHRIAESLTFEYYSKKYVVKANMEIIISAGPINSAKLLMLSGIGPKEHLDELGINIIKELPVGENYQDQITMNGIVLKFHKSFAVDADDDEISMHFKTWFHNRTGPIGSMGVSQCSALVKLYEEDRIVAPDIEFIFEGNHVRSDTFLLSNLPVLEVHSQNKPYPFYNIIIMKPVVLKPLSKGYIRLNKINPLRNKPHIHAKLLSRNEDLRNLVDSIKFIRKFLQTHDMKHIDAELMPLDYGPCNSNQTDDFWKCVARHYTKPMGRPIGTCKMGSDDDNTSVVNVALRVHGIDGLRVIDSSIMPTHVRGNIYSTTIMIAEKGAKFIKDYWTNDINDVYDL